MYGFDPSYSQFAMEGLSQGQGDQGGFGGLADQMVGNIDPMIYSGITGIDGQAPQPQQVPQVAPQSGGGSFFKNLLSGMLVGAASSGDATDPLTGFAQGALGVMHERQQEAQMALQYQQQQQRMKQQQDLYELDRANKMMQTMKFQQELAAAPQELQQKYDETAAQMVATYQRMGKNAIVQSGTSPDQINSVIQSLQSAGKNPWSDVHYEVLGDKVLYYDNSKTGDPKTDLVPPDTSITVGDTVLQPYPQETLEQFYDRVNKEKQNQFEMDKTRYQEQQATGRAVQVANINHANDSTTNGEPTPKDLWKSQLSSMRFGLDKLDSQASDIQKSMEHLQSSDQWKEMTNLVQSGTLSSDQAATQYKPLLDQMNALKASYSQKESAYSSGLKIYQQLSAKGSQAFAEGQTISVQLPQNMPYIGGSMATATVIDKRDDGLLQVELPHGGQWLYDPTTFQLMPLTQ